MSLYECDIADEVYDLLMQNTENQTPNYFMNMQSVCVDRTKACLFIDHDGQQFKIKVERV